MLTKNKSTVKVLVDSRIKERAKIVAKKHGLSLSYLVSKFLEQIVNRPDNLMYLKLQIDLNSEEKACTMIDGAPVQIKKSAK